MRKEIAIVFLPLIVAGCVGTSPQSAENNVRQIAIARIGEPVHWSSSTNAIAQSVAILLQTNLTAETATAIALLNNKSLQAQFEEIGISQADLAQASRLQNPEIFGDWRFPNQPPTPADIEYNVAMNFVDLLTLPARKRVATRNLEQTKLEVADKILQLAADAQTAFYTLQAQKELTNRLALIVAVNDAAADFAQRQYQAGNITELALNEQAASAAQSHLEWMRAKAETEIDYERLDRLLGLSGEQINWTVADELPPLPAGELSLTNLESLAVSQRFDLAAIRSEAGAIEATLRLQRRVRFFPAVTVGADTERSPDGQRVTGPMLDFELPLFDQGQPEVAKLSAEYRQAMDNYDGLKINICSEVRQARDGLLAAREEAEFAQKNLLPLRQKILGETLLHYNAMQFSVYELLLSKDREQTAEEDSIEALRDYWLARVELEQAVGGRLSESSHRNSADTAAPSDQSGLMSAAEHRY